LRYSPREAILEQETDNLEEAAMSVAIITGASRGLGRALAHHLADARWSLVLDARGSDALEATGAELRSKTHVVVVAGDISDERHRAELVEAAERLGGVDLLVNNASVLGPSPQPALADYALDILRDVYEINVVAPLALAQLALPTLRARGGTIVNITSDAAVEPYEGWGGYGSSKAALEQWGNVLAAEETRVHVYTFDPGDMRTQMHQEAFPGEDISDRPEPETVVPALAHLIERKPSSGRYRAGDFAEAVTS
jgi:NAD(P)-dependent dehydrogenase (short-subunit alcohol dehydrogenase family)